MSDRPKPRSDALLKNLPRERQEQIAEWCRKPNDRDAENEPIPESGGLAFARAQLAADGLKVSLNLLSEFLSWWQLEQDLEASFEREAQVLAKTGDPKKAREAGEIMLQRLGIATQNPKLLQVAAQVQDSRRNLDLLEETGRTKARQKEVSLRQKAEEIALAQRKFRVSTCEEFLKWSENEAAKKIATSSASNAEKIEQLGQLMFGEDWKK